MSRLQLQAALNGNVQVPGGREQAAGVGAVVLHVHAFELQEAALHHLVDALDHAVPHLVVRRFGGLLLQTPRACCGLIGRIKDRCWWQSKGVR